jgi:hypothetical protein
MTEPESVLYLQLALDELGRRRDHTCGETREAAAEVTVDRREVGGPNSPHAAHLHARTGSNGDGIGERTDSPSSPPRQEPQAAQDTHQRSQGQSVPPATKATRTVRTAHASVANSSALSGPFPTSGGTMPLKSPRTPSCRTVRAAQSAIPEYTPGRACSRTLIVSSG